MARIHPPSFALLLMLSAFLVACDSVEDGASDVSQVDASVDADGSVDIDANVNADAMVQSDAMMQADAMMQTDARVGDDAGLTPDAGVVQCESGSFLQDGQCIVCREPALGQWVTQVCTCLLYTSPSPRDS